MKILDSFEIFFRNSRENSETITNIPKIVDELNKKNESWEEQIQHQRKKNERKV